MDDSNSVQIHCWICDERLTLSGGVAAHMADVQSFYAAHTTHEDGVGVQLFFADTSTLPRYADEPRVQADA